MSLRYKGGVLSTVPPTTSTSSAVGVWTMRQQMQAQGASTWPLPKTLDPQFNYVSALLTGDGTNGAQNNTFTDSSTNNFTITRNGNTTQGSFSPYGSNWSNYLGGSSYLSAASNAAFAPSTGDFTCEAWINISVLPSSGGNASICQNDAIGVSNNTKFWFGVYNNSGTLQLSLGRHSTANRSYVNWTPSVGVWYHVAAVRQSGTVKLFINGVSQTVTGSTDLNGVSFSQNGFVVGAISTPAYINGYISNFRYVVGTAVYTSSFTPSTTPLTAVSGTVLLTCQSNSFVDNSSSPNALTANGTPSVQRFNPFGTSTAYSTTTIGGSAYFDGTGDCLVTPSTGQFTATGDFTVSFWMYPTSFATTQELLGAHNGTAAGAGNWLFELGTGAIRFFYDGNSAYIDSGALKLNSWTFVSASRSGSTVTFYINGVSQGTASYSSTFGIATKQITVGAWKAGAGGYYFAGWLSDIRLVSGSAITTVPTAPTTAIAGTGLLLSMTNAGIYDNAMISDFETVGNAQINTSVKKYGTGSISFDGTGDYLAAPTSPQFAFGTGDFTIEMWVYPNNTTGTKGLIALRTGAGGYSPFLLYQYGGGHYFYLSTTGSSWNYTSDSTTSLPASTWTHIAICRYNGTVTSYINGVGEDAASLTGSLTAGGSYLTVGASYLNENPFNGYIDDLRITKGYARYTANFTPPTSAFPTAGPV